MSKKSSYNMQFNQKTRRYDVYSLNNRTLAEKMTPDIAEGFCQFLREKKNGVPGDLTYIQKVNSFIPAAMDLTRSIIGWSESSSSCKFTRYFIAAMNRLTSRAGLRVLGPHDLQLSASNELIFIRRGREIPANGF